MRCETCGCTLFSCQCESGPVSTLVDDQKKTPVPILRVKVMVGDDPMTLLFPATSFVAGTKECRAANLREGQRIQIHQANGCFLNAIVRKRPEWPSFTKDDDWPSMREQSPHNTCKVCNHKYGNHPKDGRYPDDNLTLLCTGESVKL